MLTHQTVSHRSLLEDYIDAITTFTSNIYQLLVNNYYQACCAPFVAQKLRNVDVIIQRRSEDFFCRAHWFSQTYTPNCPPRRTITKEGLQFRKDVNNFKLQRGRHLDMVRNNSRKLIGKTTRNQHGEMPTLITKIISSQRQPNRGVRLFMRLQLKT